MQILSDRRLKKHIAGKYDCVCSYKYRVEILVFDLPVPCDDIWAVWRRSWGRACRGRSARPQGRWCSQGGTRRPENPARSGTAATVMRHRPDTRWHCCWKGQQRFLPSKNNDLSRTYVCLSFQIPHENNWTELKKTENGPIFERYFSRLTAQVSLNQDLLWSPFEKRV